MSAHHELPPGLLRYLLRRLLPQDLRGEAIRGDLLEEFLDVEARFGRRRALDWYRRQGAKVLLAVMLGRVSRRGRRLHGRVSWLDVRLGIRMLAKYPVMTLVSVFALAVGLPVGMIPLHMWSTLTAPLPVEEPERIVMLREYHQRTMRSQPPSVFDYTEWRRHLTSFEAIGAATMGLSFNVASEDGQATPVRGTEISASAFDVLRTKALLGRVFGPEDERVSAPDVVIVARDFWVSKLAGAPDVVGRTLSLNGDPHTVIGVMPEGFLFPAGDQLWLPLRVEATNDAHGGTTHLVFGRLTDGTSIDEAQSEFSIVGQRLNAELPEVHAELEPEVLPFTIAFMDERRGGLRLDLDWYSMQVMSLLMLLVACANVGMLVFARTANRSAELALRTALGASRRRIVFQLFAEACVFAALATGLGIVVSDVVAIYFQRGMGPELGLPYWADFRVTAKSALVGVGLGVFSAALAGVLPAMKFTGKAIQRTIQQGASAGSGVRFGGGFSALIVADVALSVVVCAFALGISVTVRDLPAGTALDRGSYLSAELWLPRTDRLDGPGAEVEPVSEEIRTVQGALTDLLRVESGVRGVTLASSMPGMAHQNAGMLLGDEGAGEGVRFRAATAAVGPDYFDVFDRPVILGRDFTSSDREAGARVVIVNTTFVDDVLEGRNPLGRRVRYWRPADGPWFEIVGVVPDLGTFESNVDVDGAVYHPMSPGSYNPLHVALDVGDDPAAWAPRLRELTAQVDPSAVIANPLPLDEVVSYERLGFLWGRYALGAGFLILLGMSISGVYSLMSFTVAERTKEIGIRTALGARRTSIVLTIGKRTFWQLGIGVLLGLPISVAWLHDVYDSQLIARGNALSLSLALGVLVLVAVGTLACIGPTLRALRIEATEALREGG